MYMITSIKKDLNAFREKTTKRIICAIVFLFKHAFIVSNLLYCYDRYNLLAYLIILQFIQTINTIMRSI